MTKYMEPLEWPTFNTVLFNIIILQLDFRGSPSLLYMPEYIQRLVRHPAVGVYYLKLRTAINRLNAPLLGACSPEGEKFL